MVTDSTAVKRLAGGSSSRISHESRLSFSLALSFPLENSLRGTALSMPERENEDAEAKRGNEVVAAVLSDVVLLKKEVDERE